MRTNKLFASTMLIVVAVCLFLGGRYFYNRQGPAILMYHHLAPSGTYTDTAQEKNGAILDVEHFEEQMAWLRHEGYKTLSMTEAIQYFSDDKEFPPKSVIITFDDGYESTYRYAFPILEKYRIKANVSPVVMDLVRRDLHPDKTDYQDNTLRHLTFTQLREMTDSGLVELGSHTYDSHKEINVDAKGTTNLATISRKFFTEENHLESEEEYHDRLLADFIKSAEVLKQHCGQKPVFFVYPQGKVTKDLTKIVEEAGFTAALTTKNGHMSSSSDLFHLSRCNINNDISLKEFQKIVSH